MRRPHRPAGHPIATAVLLLCLGWACTPVGTTDVGTGVADPTAPPSPAAVEGTADEGTAVEGTATEVAGPFPLRVAREIDGDSFVADDGQEYRVGMVDTAELGTCGADLAADRTYDLLRDGFRAEVYDRDVHGRAVARILTPTGDLGVILAREGLAGDRYLRDFASDNPAYAADLRDAFAAADGPPAACAGAS